MSDAFTIAGFFLVMAGLTSIGIRQAYHFETRRRFWMQLALSSSMIVGAFAFIWIGFAVPGFEFRMLSPFRHGWECSNPGSGEPVCVQTQSTDGQSSP